MSIIQLAKELKEQASIVDLLNRLGYQPAPRRGREVMYPSMLRENDQTPSFSVNDQTGVWFDHGTGRGGNIIDFGLAYWKGLNFSEVVLKIRDTLNHGPLEPVRVNRPVTTQKTPNYVVHQIKPIGTHPAITEYLSARGVFQVAKPFIREVYYYVEDEGGERNNFFSAGWQNEQNAWEVRNKFFKGCIGHKAISFLPDHPKNLAIFEGFMDFLSWKLDNPGADHSIIVLNTVALVQQAVSRAKAFSSIDVYFDRDKTGIEATKLFQKSLPYATDKSRVYDGYNDYNDKIKSALNRPVSLPDREVSGPDISEEIRRSRRR